MSEYVLVDKTGTITWYGVITLLNHITHDIDDEVIIYGISYTDNIEDATKFTCISSAFQMIHDVCNSPDEWDVVPFMKEEK